MEKFDAEQWWKLYPHRVDRFANEKAFVDFGNATCHIPGIAVQSHHFTKPFKPEILEKINVAWAMQETNGYATYLRSYALIPNESGELQVYYTTCPLDFWTSKPEFKQSSLEEYLFKIERVQ